MYIILYVHQPSSHMLWDMVNEMKLKSVLLPFSLPYLVLTCILVCVCVCVTIRVCVCVTISVCVCETNLWCVVDRKGSRVIAGTAVVVLWTTMYLTSYSV